MIIPLYKRNKAHGDVILSNVVKLDYVTCNKKRNIRLGRICIIFQNVQNTYKVFGDT